MRRPLSTTARLELFLAASGTCQICGWRLLPGTRWEVDHVIPLSLGGRDTQDNMQILCATCHGTKTARVDKPALARAERQQARHVGAFRPRRPIPGSRASRYRKTLAGRVEPRDDAKATDGRNERDASEAGEQPRTRPLIQRHPSTQMRKDGLEPNRD